MRDQVHNVMRQYRSNGNANGDYDHELGEQEAGYVLSGESKNTQASKLARPLLIADAGSVVDNADGNDNKSVDEYTLYEVLQAAIQGAIRPTMTEILSQKVAVINHKFDKYGKTFTKSGRIWEKQHENHVFQVQLIFDLLFLSFSVSPL